MLTDGLPLQALLLTVVGWASREQQRTTEYLIEENRVLKEQLGTRRLRLTDDQRRRLTEKGKQLGRQLLGHVTTIVTPDTIFTSPRSPNCNAYAERFVRSIREERLGRMIFFGGASLRRALK